jgi:hypothetical protein
MSRVTASVREKVRRRANKRCEYCQAPEGLGKFVYHVDHIIPILHSGTSELDNLAWACFLCNTHKMRDISSFDPDTKALTLLYNPRMQSWDEHFELNDNQIVGKTPVGRVTIIVLNMNSDDQLNIRRTLINKGLW